MTDEEYKEFVVKWMKEMEKRVENIEKMVYDMWMVVR